MDPKALEEFKQHSELLRFYLGLVLQTVTLALGATSGVVAYLVKDEGGATPLRRSLALLPSGALCIGLGIGFLIQHAAAVELRDRLIQLARELGFGLAPHGNILVNALIGLGGLLVTVGGGLLVAAGVTGYRASVRADQTGS
jgi:hypothetical protein